MTILELLHFNSIIWKIAQSRIELSDKVTPNGISLDNCGNHHIIGFRNEKLVKCQTEDIAQPTWESIDLLDPKKTSNWIPLNGRSNTVILQFTIVLQMSETFFLLFILTESTGDFLIQSGLQSIIKRPFKA